MGIIDCHVCGEPGKQVMFQQRKEIWRYRTHDIRICSICLRKAIFNLDNSNEQIVIFEPHETKGYPQEDDGELEGYLGK